MKIKDILLALFIVIAWGVNFIAIKVGLLVLPPLLLGALRFLLAVVPIIFFLPRPPVAWKWLLTLGLCINVGQFAFLFYGMKVGMPAGLASLVLQSQAFFTLFFAIAWFHESWCWNHIAGLLIAVGGMSVIGMNQDGNMTTAGFVFTLAAAASWGLGNVVMRRTTLNLPPFSMLSLAVWASAVAIVPLFILSYCVEGTASWRTAYQNFDWVTLCAVLYLSYIATLGGYGLWGRLMSRYPATVVAPWALLVPIVGMSSASLFLGETFSFWQGLGSLSVMAGLLVHVFGQRWKL
ncbi:O-acetylserine/cysteine efflux transporter [Propionispira arboris]|uniref:O-acetylserine/cysteine efflux transporter n=1 Tax=Propionispira arboris TaxID=84035 RepID=A0A1H6ZDA6_9FIRM|nr:EamA family transporter [Propionispira arboris]SEJ51419.1 O-acetylserine/cysteine efflux transporter [Propionispira arboris]